MEIDIPEDQVYTIEMLAADLAKNQGWKVYRVLGDESDCDIYFVDRDGHRRWFCLDGTVYNGPYPFDPNLVGDLDYRAVVGLCNLVWVCVPESVDPHRIVGIVD